MYLLKNSDLGMRTKTPIPKFNLQELSKSVTRWPQIHILHGSAFTENEFDSEMIVQQKPMATIIQSVGVHLIISCPFG